MVSRLVPLARRIGGKTLQASPGRDHPLEMISQIITLLPCGGIRSALVCPAAIGQNRITGRAQSAASCVAQASKGSAIMPEITLYHAAPSRASVVHWMLEELGEPYAMHVLNLKAGDHRKPAYLAVNPMGKVPAIKHGDVVITEVSAICTYLADAFPKAGLAVPIGDPRRGVYLKWLFFGPSCIEPAMTDRAYPRKEEPRRGALGYGDLETTMDVTAKGV